MELASNYTCINCGQPAEHWHHVVPKVLGGNDTTNCVPLCHNCHGLVHDKKMASKALQRAGIERAKVEGKYKGKSPIPVDKQAFYNEYMLVLTKKQTNIQAMAHLGLKPNTYYRRKKEFGFE